MIRSFWHKWQCKRVAFLLVPYSEDALSGADREKVEKHLETCASCEEELVALTDMSNLLRANPPHVAAPPSDLWARLQAQIEAESAPPVPAPRPVRGVPAYAVQSFLRSFVASGTVVAVAVTGILFSVNALNVLAPSQQMANKPVVNDPPPRIVFLANRKTAPVKKARPVIVAQTAKTSKVKPVAKTSNTSIAPVVRIAEANATNATVKRVRKSRRVAPIVRVDSRPVTLTARATPVAKPLPVVESAKPAAKPTYTMVAEERGTKKNAVYYQATVTNAVQVASAEPSGEETRLQPAMWLPEEGRETTVRPAASVVEDAAQLRRQQALFHYGR